mmetsp:Transcript_5279/g.13516  ORF Transcript_5279/g.13516 Transcript_5279/m.13516 type:complete len:263 (+) Transcript_5279:218-1006(+)
MRNQLLHGYAPLRHQLKAAWVRVAVAEDALEAYFARRHALEYREGDFGRTESYDDEYAAWSHGEEAGAQARLCASTIYGSNNLVALCRRTQRFGGGLRAASGRRACARTRHKLAQRVKSPLVHVHHDHAPAVGRHDDRGECANGTSAKDSNHVASMHGRLGLDGVHGDGEGFAEGAVLGGERWRHDMRERRRVHHLRAHGPVHRRRRKEANVWAQVVPPLRAARARSARDAGLKRDCVAHLWAVGRHPLRRHLDDRAGNLMA